jgi:DNA-binding beta-propeller fold protein YncE
MKSPYRLMAASLVLSLTSSMSGADQPSLLKPGAFIQIADSTGKFDFLRVDSQRHRLLAAHEEDGTADYFDLQSNTLIARLKIGGAVDTAVDTDSKFYYVSVQEAKRVAVVDTTTLKEVKSIKTAGPTDAILYEPTNHRIYVTHDNGRDVWVIDPVQASVVATITIPGAPEYMVYDRIADRIYLNLKTRNTVAVIDPSTNKVIAEWSTAPATQPHGLALDVDNHRLFSAGGNGRLVAIDTKTGIADASVDIAPRVDQIAIDTVDGIIYCAGVGKMTVVRTTGGKMNVLGDVATAISARNVAIDPNTHFVWSTYTDGKNSFAQSWAPPGP